MTNLTNMLALLNKRFPKINAVSTKEWDGTEDGIWFRMEGEAGEDGLPYFDHYAMDPNEESYVMGVRKPLHEFLHRHGWFAEPYDAGTLMAYPA